MRPRMPFSSWPLQKSDARRPAHGRASRIALLKIRGLTDKMISSFGDFIEARFFKKILAPVLHLT
jgi:hypothetical protein